MKSRPRPPRAPCTRSISCYPPRSLRQLPTIARPSQPSRADADGAHASGSHPAGRELAARRVPDAVPRDRARARPQWWEVEGRRRVDRGHHGPGRSAHRRVRGFLLEVGAGDRLLLHEWAHAATLRHSTVECDRAPQDAEWSIRYAAIYTAFHNAGRDTYAYPERPSA